MSEIYTRCQDLGIDPAAPDALDQLWNAIMPAERRRLFPYAETFGHHYHANRSLIS